MDVLDFRRGQYRRIYSGAIFGKRINRVSDFSERLFWRLVCVCDDFGNFAGEPEMIKFTVVPLLQRETSDIDAAIDELLSVGLIKRYQVKSETFLHIVDHLGLQPAPANGRRVRRFPLCVYEADEADQSGGSGIRVNPGESGGHNNQDKDQDHNQRQQQKNIAAAGFSKNGEMGELAATLGIRDIPSGNPERILAAMWSIKARADGGQKIRNPAGLLRRMLEGGFSPPATKRNPVTESPESYRARMTAIADREKQKREAAAVANVELGPIGTQLKLASKKKMTK